MTNRPLILSFRYRRLTHEHMQDRGEERCRDHGKERAEHSGPGPAVWTQSGSRHEISSPVAKALPAEQPGKDGRASRKEEIESWREIN